MPQFIKRGLQRADFLPNVLERRYRSKAKGYRYFCYRSEKEMEKFGAAFLIFFKKTDIKYQTVEKYNKRFYK